MKNFKLTIALVGALTVLLSSCGSSNNVVGNGILQKRKYNKGFHLAKKSSDKSRSKADKQEVEYADVSEKKETIQVVENTTVQSRESQEELKELNVPEKIQGNQGIVADKIDESVDMQEYRQDSNSANNESDNTTNASVFEVKNEEQKQVLRNDSSESTSDSSSSAAVIALFLLIILAIILPPIAVGLATRWDGKLTLISIILWILGLIPGIVFALYIVLTR